MVRGLYRRRKIGSVKLSYILSTKKIAEIMSELEGVERDANWARKWLRSMGALIPIAGTARDKYHMRYGTTLDLLREANPEIAFAIERENSTGHEDE